MRKILQILPILALLLVSSHVMAAPLCVDSTVASYVALGAGGCQIGDKLFSDFQVTNAGSWVNATVINPDPLHQGLQFGGVFLAFPNTPFVASLSYNVSVIGGSNLIHDMSLSVGGIGVIPSGVIFSVGEDILDAHNNVLGGLEVGNLNGPLVIVSTATFGPVSFIHVNKDITIVNNNTNGQPFNFSEVSQIVSQTGVPEPATLGLIGFGLVGFAMVRRKKGRQPDLHA